MSTCAVYKQTLAPFEPEVINYFQFSPSDFECKHTVRVSPQSPPSPATYPQISPKKQRRLCKSYSWSYNLTH
jgi:hypothetical protein